MWVCLQTTCCPGKNGPWDRRGIAEVGVWDKVTSEQDLWDPENIRAEHGGMDAGKEILLQSWWLELGIRTERSRGGRKDLHEVFWFSQV